MSCMQKTSLKFKETSWDLVKFASLNFHYSKKIPTANILNIAVFENLNFIGVVSFISGMRGIGSPFNLSDTECCELVRVALKAHQSPTSQILSECLKILKKIRPERKLIVSYSDLYYKHYGILYQATNWTFIGISKSSINYFAGKVKHPRSSGNGIKIKLKKHFKDFKEIYMKRLKYVYLLDNKNKELKKLLEGLKKPYLKPSSKVLTE